MYTWKLCIDTSTIEFHADLTILSLCNFDTNNRSQFELHKKKKKNLTINSISENASLDFLLQRNILLICYYGYSYEILENNYKQACFW